MNNHYTKLLSDYLCELKYEAIPTDVIEIVKKLTMHTLGAALASLPIDQAANAISYAQRRGGVAEATIWGSSGKKVPAVDAVFANGTMADILDWEDCAWTGHPCAGAIPDAFALCEKYGRSGREYIESIVAAFEVYQRIALSAIPSDEWYSHKAWGLVSWQIMAGAMAAAKVMKLNADQVAQTMGMAYYMTLANVQKHASGGAKSDVYHYAHGFVARNGINAAEIAEIGYGNMYDTLDGKNGYWNCISDSIDWTWLDRDLGTRFLIRECVMEKDFPANMWIQVPLTIMRHLVEEYKFEADDVERVEVTPLIPMLMASYEESTRDVLDAQFSIPYCLTAYMLDHTPGAHWFSNGMRNSDEISKHTGKFVGLGEKTPTFKLFKTFRSGTYPEFTITVYLKDGRRLSRSERYSKGQPNNPYTYEEECDMFRLMAGPVLPKEQVEEIIEQITNLENLENLDKLAALTTLSK